MTAGIYGIFDKRSGRCLYIGQSVSIEGRLKAHRNALINGTHARNEFNSYFREELQGDPELLDCRRLAIAEEQALRSSLELSFFDEHKPLFYGQKPSKDNKYMEASPEAKASFRRTMTQLIAQARRGYREEAGRRIWLRNCVACSKDFEGIAPTAVYCSTVCRSTFKGFAKVCEDCGVGFASVYAATLWCNHCKYRQNAYSAICLHCSKEFEAGASFAKYCSAWCKARAPKPFVCTRCGVKFFHGSKRLTCDECSREGRYSLICLQCSQEFFSESGNTKHCDTCKEKAFSCKGCGRAQAHRRLCEGCKLPNWSSLRLTAPEVERFKNAVENEFWLGAVKSDDLASQWGLTRKGLYKRLHELYPERYK